LNKAIPMNKTQFSTVTRLIGGDPASAANQAAYLVLVEGYQQKMAVITTGATKQTVSDAVKRYRTAWNSIRQVYLPGCKTEKMTESQFSLVTHFLNGDPTSSANKSAKEVLIDGVSQVSMTKKYGVTKSTVCNAVSAYSKAHELICLCID
jgi:transposase